ncbi:MAG: efflux RND transporter periplasmic adaptor subunit [Planctomycetes bacterium]|nr:efflux RND transporter periplasmic adaptor subunit [Planctomycetota bacterium]
MKLTKEDIDLTLSASGEALPFDEVTVSSKGSGVIEKIFFDEGDHVKRGDLLAEIEHKKLQYQVDKAASMVAIAEASLAKAKVPYRPEEIRSLEANLDRAKAGLEDAKLDLDRARDLLKSRTISQGDWDDAQSSYRIKSAEYADALEKLNLAKSGGRKEDVQIAEAELRERQSDLNLAKENLSDTRITCELTGIVSERYVSRGERVTEGSSITKVVDISKIKVEIYVPEVDYDRIRIGNSARIMFRPFPTRKFKGTVTLKGVSADQRTRTFKIELTIDNPDERIRPGMTADVTLTWATRPSVIAIPEQALLTANGDTYVYLAEHGTAVRRNVKHGLRQHGLVIIAEGLSEGDLVVVSGQGLLTDGAAIAVTSQEQ